MLGFNNKISEIACQHGDSPVCCAVHDWSMRLHTQSIAERDDVRSHIISATNTSCFKIPALTWHEISALTTYSHMDRICTYYCLIETNAPTNANTNAPIRLLLPRAPGFPKPTARPDPQPRNFLLAVGIGDRGVTKLFLWLDVPRVFLVYKRGFSYVEQ